jgi:hypothetical protein
MPPATDRLAGVSAGRPVAGGLTCCSVLSVLARRVVVRVVVWVAVWVAVWAVVWVAVWVVVWVVIGRARSVGALVIGLTDR